jgi:hypothetical protein
MQTTFFDELFVINCFIVAYRFPLMDQNGPSPRQWRHEA